MRYLTVRLSATEGGAFHPVGRRLADEPSVQREAIHHVELLADRTVLTLEEASGDRDRYEELMAAAPEVRDCLVSGDRRWMATSRFAARERVERILEWRRQSELVFETPVAVNGDGSLRVTFLGDESAFQRLYEYATESAGLEVDVLRTGTYDPDAAPFVRSLTERQQEVLRTAVDLGYYSNPREATHDDVADALGIAPTTAGDHLREIESRVFETLAG